MIIGSDLVLLPHYNSKHSCILQVIKVCGMKGKGIEEKELDSY